MTKAVLDIDSELWKQARHYALEHRLTNNEMVTHALQHLLTAGPIHERMAHLQPTVNTTQPYDTVTMTQTMPTATLGADFPSLRGFGTSRPAPKPMKKTR